MKRVKVLTNQSIFDLALQEYGQAEGIVQLMLDNNNVITDLDSDLVPGTTLFVKGSPFDTAVVTQLQVVARAYPEATNAHLATWPPYEPPAIEHLILTEDYEPILTESQQPLQTEF